MNSLIFSVVIPTCNRNDFLAKCLLCLAPGIQTLNSEHYEIIVTDDSKDNIARPFLEENYPWVTWVEGKKKGPASNRNGGASKARGEWLVFIDDDCLPETNILQEYKSVLEENIGINVLEGRIEAIGKSTSPLEYAPVNTHGGNLWSCNFAIKKDLFFKINGFDEYFKYPHLEDNDLKLRLLSYNEKTLFCGKCVVFHPWRKLTDGVKLGKYHEMSIYFYLKHDQSFSRSGIFLNILKTHYHMIKRYPYNKEIFKAIWVMLLHAFTMAFYYRTWYTKYTKTDKLLR